MQGMVVLTLAIGKQKISSIAREQLKLSHYDAWNQCCAELPELKLMDVLHCW